MLRIGKFKRRVAGTMATNLYHRIYGAVGANMVKMVKSSMERQKQDLDIVGNKLFKHLITMLVFLLIGRFLIPVPLDKTGVPKPIDSTIWVGFLSFEGMFVIGTLAVAPVVLKAVNSTFQALLVGAVRANVVKFEDGTTADEFEKQWETETDKKEAVDMHKETTQLVISAGFYLVALMFAMPLQIWLSPRWIVGVMLSLFIWGVSNVSWMFMPLMWIYNSENWNSHDKLKKEHDENIEFCKICRKAQRTSVSNDLREVHAEQ